MRDGQLTVDAAGQRLFVFKWMVLRLGWNVWGEWHSLCDGGRAEDSEERLWNGGHGPASARMLRLWHV